MNYVVRSIEDRVLNNPDKATPPMKPFSIPDGTSMSDQLVHEEEMEWYDDELELHQIKQKKHVDMIIKLQVEWGKPMPFYGGSAPNIWILSWNQ